MSGGITQLIAIGAQDAHIVGKPEVSFFQSAYKRHTNFAHVVDRQIIQGNVSNNGMSTVRFERKGDLLSYVYLTPHNGTTSQSRTAAEWKTDISKVELLIGGQVIDEQTSEFSVSIAPDVFAQNLTKSVKGGHFDGGNGKYFYPLRFSFCENWQSALPLVALQYHDVEIRITWGSTAANNRWDCYAGFVFLDTAERQMFSSKEHQYLIYQVQKSVSSGAKVQDLNFNHPIKFLTSNNTSGTSGLCSASNKVKLQINGVDIADYKFACPHFTQISSFYHSPFAADNATALFVYPFCLETSKLQPTGSLNFSRLDSARIVSETVTITDDVYAINYNILKISNGMGGLMYAN